MVWFSHFTVELPTIWLFHLLAESKVGMPTKKRRVAGQTTLSNVLLRKIGDASVPAIGFGAMGISCLYGAVGSDEERFKIFDAAYAAGCTFWDTADVYLDSEDLIGKWFKRNPGKRDSIFLATKFGITMQGSRGEPEYVKQQCYTSLKRLGVDYIDLYYQHRVDPKVPIEKTVEAMAELVKEGKVKYLGLSDCTASGLRRAHAIHLIAALQIEYSPFVLDVEKPPLKLLQTARELGVKIIAYSPLGRGLLTGQVRSRDDLEPNDFRLTIPKFKAGNFPKILFLVDRIGDVAKRHGATPGQAVLAWILAQGEDFFVIPGTKKIKYLEENISAGSLKLSSEEVAEIRHVAEETEIPGERYGPGALETTYVESPPLK
ncbi:NADP-dependent oxidoreductase domain-containing protein [Desarmillaria tabescens]|uniref:NADP-dependent oxidoreductase domain-containing protein n=1 Tax=Armillaria tabescens TaxID=1929756 RepID=A0AA39MUA9_ARMTA|nr:NADP-dependent oxidoreductase domain-containing protein [Desarmillaria tabescens]KAK0447376.1 NADP-dependent oxidoreductase domain-containing protein [Desarmillaria tabescens]